MLIGAHVSPAGGPCPTAVRQRGERAGRRGDPDLQPEPARLAADASTPTRRSRPTTRRWSASGVEALLIHAVYLLNCACEDREIRDKSLASLIASLLRSGDALGAHAVVLHAGSAQGRRRRPAIERAGEGHREALAESERAARCTSRTPPARAARWGARSRSWPR